MYSRTYLFYSLHAFYTMQICNFSLQFKPILHFVLSLQIIEWHLHVAKIKLIGILTHHI